MIRLAALLACLAGPLHAEALGIRQPDALRLAELYTHLGAALAQALATGDPAALAVMEEAMRGAAMPADEANPAGDWACRTIKLGGVVTAVAYGAFRCRIVAAGPGRWTLAKLTGSQRTVGILSNVEGMELRYLGTGHVGDAPATDYAGLPPEDQTPVEPNQTHADTGIFQQMSPDRARLLLPAPVLESRFDILYLTR